MKIFFLTLMSGLISSMAVADTYTVQLHESLSEIAFKLYGNYSAWKKIAEWNGLNPPYSVSVGQRLSLREPPKLDAEAGKERVVYMWKRRFEIRDGGRVSEPVSPAEFHDAYEKGEIAFLDERYDLALEKFERCRTGQPSYLAPWYYSVEALKRLGRKAEAQKLLTKVPRSIPLPEMHKEEVRATLRELESISGLKWNQTPLVNNGVATIQGNFNRLDWSLIMGTEKLDSARLENGGFEIRVQLEGRETPVEVLLLGRQGQIESQKLRIIADSLVH